MPQAAKENTLRSFELALECGAQGIELDVHSTADGIIVVHHDPALADGTLICGTTMSQLARLATDLATLDSVCKLVAGRAELFVEIKGGGIERLVEERLVRYPGPLALHSFDHELIARLNRGGTTRRLGILIEDNPSNYLESMERSGALDLWPHHPLVSSEMVASVHAIGGRVIPWTVNGRADVERIQAFAVDGICTDDVCLLKPA